jgi:hypothetical protein
MAAWDGVGARANLSTMALPDWKSELAATLSFWD